MLSRQFDHTYWHEGDQLKAQWKGTSGMGGAAQDAHEYYKRTAPKAHFDHPGETYEQLKLPGSR